ncbi:alpha/beta hydrolase domain-containing protein [Gimesia maris]|uniref:alpha/beta hydrolase domain-containing protein n=1 Tax=Gimesia maris TaxID=122 RepID=UPI0032EEA352
MNRLLQIFNVVLVYTLLAAPLCAELTRFEITDREPFADGHKFGTVGEYERIKGRVYYELDPDLPQNQNVVDLKLAPRNQRGRVELSADLLILAPKDLSKGNGALLYDVNNRGNLTALRMINFASGGNDPKTMSQAGDGFLMKHGFTFVSSGWDGELLPGSSRLSLVPPTIQQPITGKVRCEIVPSKDTPRTVVNWAAHGSYRPTAQGLEQATLTHRLRAGHPRVPIPRAEWKLHVTEVEGGAPAQLPKVELEYPAGLKKLEIYELIYEAQDPTVMGTGFTAVRDLVSALKQGTGDGNPLLVAGKPVIQRAHSFGVSQSGRFLREMLYWGFNEDEAGRQVFEGVIPHVSGSGMGSFNHRFAQPTRHAGQHDHHDYPPDRFPFSYSTQTDPLSGLTEGILTRAAASGTAPLVMHTQSSSEYWNRSGSLTHTDPLGTADVALPENVRIYIIGGTQHGPSRYTTEKGDGQTAPNPADYKPFLRALLLALDQWAKDGTAPPASVYPKISEGTLVSWTQNATSFPHIPGIRYPAVIQQPAYLDFGPRWQTERIIDLQPPLPRGDYRVLVPRSGPDGNELGCLSAPEVAVPVATYTSWRLRDENGPAANQLYSLSGSMIPFPLTKSEREQKGDPRPSLEERYGTLETYLQQLSARCQTYEQSGYLLPEDRERILDIQKERVAPMFEKMKEQTQADPKEQGH